jgi:PPM family protein phosphatase
VKVPPGFVVGACSHTGRVRGSNEDDYLLAAPAGHGPFLVAIADGMGGLTGGAEASRTALRALGAAVLDGGNQAGLADRLRAGFAAASARVHEAASAVPALRDMGTTMTALCFAEERAGLGHIGDTRAYRLRAGHCKQLTTDHAVRRPDNLLTRCIGAGHATSVADLGEFATRPGDRYLLLSDGVWSVIDDQALLRAAASGSAQQAADGLVAMALQAGGPDNASAVVVDLRPAGAAAGGGEVELPRDERDFVENWPPPVSLRAPVWPWLLLVAALWLLLPVIVRWFGADGLAGRFEGWLPWRRG